MAEGGYGHGHRRGEAPWSIHAGLVARACAALAHTWMGPEAQPPSAWQRQRVASLLWALDVALAEQSAGPLVEYCARLGYDHVRAGLDLEEPLRALALVRRALGTPRPAGPDAAGQRLLLWLLEAGRRALTEGSVTALCERQLEWERQARPRRCAST